MKRVTSAIAILIAASAGGVATASAGTSALVAGSGRLGAQYGSPTVQVSARGTGAESSGVFHIKYPDAGMIKGTVTCVFMTANVAYIVGQIEQSKNEAWLVGSYVEIGVQDNGASLDNANFSPDQATPPACGPSIIATPNLPLVSGNFVIRNGT